MFGEHIFKKIFSYDSLTLISIIYRLMTLAFAGSIGMTLVILACALPNSKYVFNCCIKLWFHMFNCVFFFSSWWPFIVVVFYVLAPLPTMLMKRYNDFSGSGNANMELAVFITMGIVVSSFALPIIMSRVSSVSYLIHFWCQFLNYL